MKPQPAALIVTEDREPEVIHDPIQHLLRHDFPKRYSVARSMTIAPLAGRSGNEYANGTNLRLIVALAPDPTRILAGRIAGVLGWDLLHVKTILRWGCRLNVVEKVSNNVFKITPRTFEEKLVKAEAALKAKKA